MNLSHHAIRHTNASAGLINNVIFNLVAHVPALAEPWVGLFE